MRGHYDRSVDALFIELRAGAKSVRTERVTDEVRVDFDREGHAIGVEVLNASWHMPMAMLSQLPTAAKSYTLVEASGVSGLSASTLRVQIHNRRIRATKRGRDWYVDATSLENYLESRETRSRVRSGRPARATRRRARR